MEFTDLALGSDHGCGIELDGTVTCWGDADQPLEAGEECRFNECGQGVPPEGTFTKIAATDSATCALDASGAMSCWGTRTMGLEGTFVDMDGSTEALCGLQVDGAIACTGGVPAPPSLGPYTQVAVGPGAVCGVKQGGIDCSGLDNQEGQFARVTVGDGFACALLIDGTPYCWGDGLRILPPEGPLGAIVATDQFACGLDLDGALECWGEGQEGGIDNSTCLQDHAVLSGTLQGAAANIDWEIGDSWGRVPANGFAWNITTSDGTSSGRLLLTGSEDLGTEDITRFALMDGQSVQIAFGTIWMPGGCWHPSIVQGRARRRRVRATKPASSSPRSACSAVVPAPPSKARSNSARVTSSTDARTRAWRTAPSAAASTASQCRPTAVTRCSPVERRAPT